MVIVLSYPDQVKIEMGNPDIGLFRFDYEIDDTVSVRTDDGWLLVLGQSFGKKPRKPVKWRD